VLGFIEPGRPCLLIEAIREWRSMARAHGASLQIAIGLWSQFQAGVTQAGFGLPVDCTTGGIRRHAKPAHDPCTLKPSGSCLKFRKP